MPSACCWFWAWAAAMRLRRRRLCWMSWMVWMVRLQGSEGMSSMVVGRGLLAEGWCSGGSCTSTVRNSRCSRSKELRLAWLEETGISPQYRSIFSWITCRAQSPQEGYRVLRVQGILAAGTSTSGSNRHGAGTPLQPAQAAAARQAVAQRSVLDGIRLPLRHFTDGSAASLRGEGAETNALVRRKLFLWATRAAVGPPGPRRAGPAARGNSGGAALDSPAARPPPLPGPAAAPHPEPAARPPPPTPAFPSAPLRSLPAGTASRSATDRGSPAPRAAPARRRAVPAVPTAPTAAASPAAPALPHSPLGLPRAALGAGGAAPGAAPCPRHCSGAALVPGGLRLGTDPVRWRRRRRPSPPSPPPSSARAARCPPPPGPASRGPARRERPALPPPRRPRPATRNRRGAAARPPAPGTGWRCWRAAWCWARCGWRTAAGSWWGGCPAAPWPWSTRRCRGTTPCCSTAAPAATPAAPMPPGSTCTTWAAPTARSWTRRGCRPAPTAGCGWATGCASAAAPASSSCRWVRVGTGTRGKGWHPSGSGIYPASSGDCLRCEAIWKQPSAAGVVLLREKLWMSAAGSAVRWGAAGFCWWAVRAKGISLQQCDVLGMSFWQYDAPLK